MVHPWLHDRCREFERASDGYLDLWAREHYKSTIITFGGTLQDILASHGEDPEPRWRGREVTCGILSFNRPTAKAFLRQLKFEMETNEDLKGLFPDVLWEAPHKDSPKWSEDEGLIVRRKSNPKEATIEAYGLVDGQPTSKHFLLRVYDDVVTRDSVTTPEMSQKVTEAWELSDNLGTEGGRVRYVGTRYALADTYDVMIRRGIPIRVYPCTSDGSEDWSKAVLKAPEELARKRRLQGPYTFGAQMLLNPLADTAQGFRRDWLRYWSGDSAYNMTKVMLVDPANAKKRTSDYTAIWVVGLGSDRKYRLIDGIRDRLNLTQRVDLLFKLHRKHTPAFVGYEQYGLQADIAHAEFRMNMENYQFTITPLGGQMPKEDRIRRLVPLFEQGRMLLPAHGLVRTNYEGHAVDIVQEFIEDEYVSFPLAGHDDSLDCLSRLCDPIVAATPWPLNPEDFESDKPDWLIEAEQEALAAKGGGWMAA